MPPGAGCAFEQVCNRSRKIACDDLPGVHYGSAIVGLTLWLQQINEAWERMLKQDVRYRFVIDMASLKG
jgi:hypothetical protein